MATSGRIARDPLIRELEQEAWAFEFHQAVRILEAALDGEPVGRGSHPAREAIRFRSRVSLAFPASEVTSVRIPLSPLAKPKAGAGPDPVTRASPRSGTGTGAQGQQAELEVAFLGLANALGPLPRPFTEWILDRVAKKDTAFRDFLDIFNHRLVAYHYRSREKHRPGLRFVPPESSTLAEPLYALAGLAEPAQRDRTRLPDRALLPYAAAVGRPRPIAQLVAGSLTHHFGVPFRPAPFQGRWLRLEPERWSRLGTRGVHDAEGGLGRDTVLGTRAWDQSAVFELEAGPLDRRAFDAFLPGDSGGRVPDGGWLASASDLVKMHVSPGTRVELRLALKPDAVIPAVLGTGSGSPRLGYSAWLGSRKDSSPARNVTIPLV
jgi:type VI secretion system protein ImpH